MAAVAMVTVMTVKTMRMLSTMVMLVMTVMLAMRAIAMVMALTVLSKGIRNKDQFLSLLAKLFSFHSFGQRGIRTHNLTIVDKSN